MSVFKGNERLEILGYELYHLISIGKKESVDDIINKISEGNVVHYISEKYKDEIASNLAGECPYDINEWEKVLEPYGYITRGHNVIRKMGIMNEDDGLLVLSFLILEELATNRK